MKEIIAKRNKISYAFLFFLCVFTVLTSVFLLNQPTLTIVKYVSPAIIALCGIYSIVLLILLVSPNGAIEREGETLVIRRGITKTTVNISDITDVFPTPHPNNKDLTLKNNVTVKTTADGKEKLISCPDIADVESTIQKIKTLINS